MHIRHQLILLSDCIHCAPQRSEIDRKYIVSARRQTSCDSLADTHLLLDIREAFCSPLLERFQNVWLSYCGNHWNLAVCGSQESVHVLYHIQPRSTSCTMHWWWCEVLMLGHQYFQERSIWLQYAIMFERIPYKDAQIFYRVQEGHQMVLEVGDLVVNGARQISIGNNTTLVCLAR